jgi:glucokinase
MELLCGDIGGTKTLLQRVAVQKDSIKVLAEQRYPSADYSSFDDILAKFLAHQEHHAIVAACFGVAGPVEKHEDTQRASITNLPWQMDSDQLAERFALSRVALINDFEAVAHGIDALPGEDLISLQKGQPVAHGNRLVIGAGTGLGIAQMVWNGSEYLIIPTEGGHADFAPANSEQLGLSDYLIRTQGRCSVEFVVSGPGLVNIFSYIAEVNGQSDSDQYQKIMQAADPAAAIANAADRGDSALASHSMELFVQAYGGQAGNFALACLPLGGVYVAGGIAAKISARLQEGEFIAAFNAKGKMAALMQNIPVKVVTNPAVGLIGSRVYAQRLCKL